MQLSSKVAQLVRLKRSLRHLTIAVRLLMPTLPPVPAEPLLHPTATLSAGLENFLLESIFAQLDLLHHSAKQLLAHIFFLLPEHRSLLFNPIFQSLEFSPELWVLRFEVSHSPVD